MQHRVGAFAVASSLLHDGLASHLRNLIPLGRRTSSCRQEPVAAGVAEEAVNYGIIKRGGSAEFGTGGGREEQGVHARLVGSGASPDGEELIQGGDVSVVGGTAG